MKKVTVWFRSNPRATDSQKLQVVVPSNVLNLPKYDKVIAIGRALHTMRQVPIACLIAYKF